jgi:hypothetical protein
MEAFRWVTVIVSILLGLGLTRILTSAISVFLARKRASLDWLPLVWAGTIFLQQIGFWWSLDELSKLVPHWTLGAFLFLVCIVLSLFIAAALILPSHDMGKDESLRDYFQMDGRWALLAVCGFNTLAIFANIVFWHSPIISLDTCLNLIVCLTPMIAFLGARPVQVGATAAQALIVPVSFIVVLPSGY